jgi:hypothetical protein
MMKNANLGVFRNHFVYLANHYKFKLHRNLTNNEVLDIYDKDFPDSLFVPTKFRFFISHQPHTREIQKELLEMIHNA